MKRRGGQGPRDQAKDAPPVPVNSARRRRIFWMRTSRGPPAHGASGRRSPPWHLSSTRCHRCVRRWGWRCPPPPEACAAGETDRPRFSFRGHPAKEDIFQRTWVPSTVCERGNREDRSSKSTDSASLSRRPHDSWFTRGCCLRALQTPRRSLLAQDARTLGVRAPFCLSGGRAWP